MRTCKLRPLGEFSRKLKVKCRIVKLKKNLRGKIDKCRVTKNFDEAYNILSRMKRGLWIVQFVEAEVVDHCLTIHCKRGILYDSEEPYPLRLSVKTTTMCGGPHTSKLHVAKVGEIKSKEFYISLNLPLTTKD